MQTPWLKYYSPAKLQTPIPKLNVYDYLRQQNQDSLDLPALDYLGRRYSYDEFFALVEKTAHACRAWGIKAGDQIGMCLLMTPESLILFYALAKIGAVSNWFDPRSSSQEIQTYLTQAPIKFLATLNVFLPKITPIAKKTKVTKVVVLSPLTSLPPKLKFLAQLKNLIQPLPPVPKNKTYLSWSAFLALAPAAAPPLPSVYQPNLLLTVMHTSGTTGQPKGVMISHDNLNFSVEQCRQMHLEMLRGDSCLAYIPPFIIVGLANCVQLPLSLGMRTIIIPNFDLLKLGRLLIKTKPNHVISIPLHCQEIINSPALAKADLSFLKTIFVGGDLLSPELETQVNQFLFAHGSHIRLSKGYGLTETTSCCTSGCNHETYNLLGSAGIPMYQTQLKIVDPDTWQTLPPEKTGEICFTGANVMLGYLNNPAATRQVLRRHRDGKTWLHTGDLAYLTSDGILYLDGRLKRLIIRRGFKVAPSVIEKVISQHQAVAQCVVVGIPDPDEINVPRAHIVLKPAVKEQQNQVEQELQQLCQEKLANHFWPKVYFFQNSIPLTKNGKADYRALEQL
jgi:long-chain acyl-CoA synthetase